MTRKIFYLTFLFCLSFALNTSAQQGNKDNDQQKKARFEEFKAKREAYISKEMELTDDESKAFWPICNDLQEKKFQLNRTLRAEIRKIQSATKEGKEVSDTEYNKIIDLTAETKIKEAQLDKEYIEKFKKIIPAEKVYKYLRAEQHFAKMTIGERGKRQNNQK